MVISPCVAIFSSLATPTCCQPEPTVCHASSCMAIYPERSHNIVLGDKIHAYLIEHRSSFSIDSMSSQGGHHLQPWNFTLGKGPVRVKALFALATDEQPW